jgi:hypothetical protein
MTRIEIEVVVFGSRFFYISYEGTIAVDVIAEEVSGSSTAAASAGCYFISAYDIGIVLDVNQEDEFTGYEVSVIGGEATCDIT